MAVVGATTFVSETLGEAKDRVWLALWTIGPSGDFPLAVGPMKVWVPVAPRAIGPAIPWFLRRERARAGTNWARTG
jgi:hypothetical protein